MASYDSHCVFILVPTRTNFCLQELLLHGSHTTEYDELQSLLRSMLSRNQKAPQNLTQLDIQRNIQRTSSKLFMQMFPTHSASARDLTVASSTSNTSLPHSLPGNDVRLFPSSRWGGDDGNGNGDGAVADSGVMYNDTCAHFLLRDCSVVCSAEAASESNDTNDTAPTDTRSASRVAKLRVVVPEPEEEQFNVGGDDRYELSFPLCESGGVSVCSVVSILRGLCRSL